MKVIILAAGYATRLYPLTKDKPKALLAIGSKPLLDHLMDKIIGIGSSLDEVILVTNHLFFEQFETWAKAYRWKCRIRVFDDQTTSNDDRLGAIGDLEFAVEKGGVDDDVLVLASDNLFDGGLEEFVGFAKSKKDAGAVGVYDLKDPMLGAKRYGIMTLDRDKRILRIDEKPEKPSSSYASMGIYYFPKSSLRFIKEYLAHPDKKDAPGHYVSWLLERISIYAHIFQGRWFDIGSLDQLEEAGHAYEYGV